MAAESSAQLAISVPRYDGPFDLLVSLIRRNEYPIDALPVSEITGQFLAYVRAARDLESELAGEFVEVASWLVLLKSRSMLPHNGQEPAPHEELRRAVLDHQTLAAATEFLRSQAARSRPGAAGAPPGRGEAGPVEVDAEPPTVLDLVEAARRALEAAHAARSLEGTEAVGATVEEMIDWIRATLGALRAGEAVSTRDWFRVPSGEGAALLLAMLEMAGKGALLLHQERECGEIRVKAAVRKRGDARSSEYAGSVAG
jgi:segregation and condensation protein A